MVRSIIGIAFLLLLTINVNCQQWPIHTQYMLNKYRDNPAYGGLERSLSTFVSYRDQYNSLNGNPKTLYIGADMPIYIWNGALGFSVYNQKAGVINNSDVKLSYNYVMGTPLGFVSIGGRLGVDIVNINSAGIVTPDGDYEGGFNHNDPFIENNNFSGHGLSGELGAYFYGSNIEAGITLMEIPNHGFRLGSGRYNRRMAAGVFFQYKYQWTEDLIILPSAMIRIDKAVLQTDFGAFAKIKQDFLIGFNCRGYNSHSIDSGAFIIGTNIGKKYFITYSYDFGLSSLRSYNQGSHEIMLSYNLQKLIGIGLPPGIIYNPRDL
jgi:type IX secretion system PorP/SprF family membrane protein